MASLTRNRRRGRLLLGGDGDGNLTGDADFAKKQLVPAMASLVPARRLETYRQPHGRRSFCIRVFFFSGPMYVAGLLLFLGIVSPVWASI